MTNLHLMIAEECFVREIDSEAWSIGLFQVRKIGGPFENFRYQKAVTVKLSAIQGALIELWKEKTCVDGRVKLQGYFNKLYLKVLSIFCKMVYTSEL